jgi:hypothetical protein
MPKQKISTKSNPVRDPSLVKLKLENYLLTAQWAALLDLRMSLEQSAQPPSGITG